MFAFARAYIGGVVALLLEPLRPSPVPDSDALLEDGEVPDDLAYEANAASNLAIKPAFPLT
tara:strand:- start:605 stop:787 length:183 start_codon:yes stop_codon:yes gene_type:complete